MCEGLVMETCTHTFSTELSGGRGERVATGS